MSAYSSQHYRENKAVYKTRAKVHNDKQRDVLRLQLVTYLRQHPCIDCGEVNPILLEFDHKAGVDKSFSIGSVFTYAQSWPMILREIEKCDVQCVRCQRLKTVRERGCYRYLMSETIGTTVA